MHISSKLVCAFAWTALVGAGASGADAQTRFAPAPFPMELRAQDTEAGEVRFALRTQDVERLTELTTVSLTDIAMPDGSLVDVDLERVDLSRHRFEYYVDDRYVPNLANDLGLSVWMGQVSGGAGTSVALSFSHYGSQGWIQQGTDLVHLMTRRSPDGDWSKATYHLVTEGSLLAAGNAHSVCEASSLDLPGTDDEPVAPTVRGGQQNLGGPQATLECRIAIETDWQLYNDVFGGDLLAETSYITTLLAWVGYRYEEQIDTVFTYPYIQFYTSSNDPWTSQDFGGSSVDLLYEFQAAWVGNIPNNADLGAFLSGANLGGGVAWRPGLCDPDVPFSVSGNIGAGVQFPVTQQGGNWDFMVVAHELGHNFSSPHTHSYCPPLDECAPSGYFGSCQTQQNCTNMGTIMSYCHLCNGGTANVTTYFHPQVVSDMRFHAETNCLPNYNGAPQPYCIGKVNSQGCMPAIGWSGAATLGGPDNFHITASNVLNNKAGLLFYGFQPIASPFQGGTICVKSPVRRTPIQLSSGGNPPPDDCSGTYDFHFTHAFMIARGLSAGDSAYAQYWMRDPASASTTGLTNALYFTIIN